MNCSPLVQAAIVYMKDHYPTTPKELNFHAELKAASKWYWLKDSGNTSALEKVPADDCQPKFAVRETLKTWKKEKEDLEAKVQTTDDSDEELSGEPEKPRIEHSTDITEVKVHIPLRCEFFRPYLGHSLSCAHKLVMKSTLVIMGIAHFCYAS